jgi:hypothetical protein
MKITHRYTGQTLFEFDGDMKATVEAAVKARADLAGADLARADLVGANLEGADLARADLAGANLAGANLEGANLEGADLARADLEGASIKMSPDTRIETGETWKEYLEQVVPQLIAAGGHAVTERAWACHTWDNCPMAEAFGVHATSGAPILLRPRIDQFVRYFDAGLIPMPECVVKEPSHD